jgi:hypothetical protein
MSKAVLATLLAAVAFTMGSACVLNSTHCQCTSVPASGICLRHFSGSGSSSVCQQYNCDAGVACDCKAKRMRRRLCDDGAAAARNQQTD